MKSLHVVFLLGVLVPSTLGSGGFVRIPPSSRFEVVRPPLERDRAIRTRLRMFQTIRTPDLVKPRLQRAVLDSPVIMRILAIRVRFPEEIPDDPLTTGNGRFILEPTGDPIDTVTPCGDTFYNPYYEPPHDKTYFERQLEALAHYVNLWTYGRVKIEWRVVPDEPDSAYVLPHPMRYYGDETHFEQGLVNLARDALLAADQDPRVSFEDIDQNGTRDYDEGVLPRYVIFHAGSAWQTDLNFDTPYDIAAVTLPPGIFDYYLGVPYLVLNEGQDTVYDVAILPETMSQDGATFMLQGTLIHEAGHFLFFQPDLYDVYGQGAGIGAWGIMGSGSYLSVPGAIPPGLLPPLPNAWERYWTDSIIHLLWDEPYDARQGVFGPSLSVISPPDSPTTFALYPGMILTDSAGVLQESPGAHPRFLAVRLTPEEWYFLEYKKDNLRANDSVYVCNGDTLETAVYGRWKDGVVVHFYGENDYLLPGSGLLVWHIDDGIIRREYAYNTVNAVRPMGVDLVEADGVQDLETFAVGGVEEIFGSPYDPFRASHNATLAPWTFPPARLNSGADAPLVIESVSDTGDSMVFALRPPDLLPPFPIPFEDTTGRWVTLANSRQIVLVDLGDPLSDSTHPARVFLYQGNTFSLIVQALSPRVDLVPSPILSGDTLLLVWTDGTAEALDLAQGITLWQNRLPVQLAFSPPQVDSGKLWIGSESGEVLGLHLQDGQIVFRAFVGEPVRGRFARVGDTLIVQSVSGQFHLLSISGQERLASFGITSGAPTTGGPLVFRRGQNLEIAGWVSDQGFVRYASDGTLLHHTPASGMNTTPPVVYREGNTPRVAVVLDSLVRIYTPEGGLLDVVSLPADSAHLVVGAAGLEGGLLLQISGIGAFLSNRVVAEDFAGGDLPSLVDLNGDGRLEVVGYTGSLVYARSLTASGVVSSSRDVLQPLAVSPSASSFRVQVFPNPAYRTGRAFLRVTSPASGTLRYEIFSFGGERLEVRRAPVSPGLQDIPLPVEDLAAGPYFVVVELSTPSGTHRDRVKFLLSPRGLRP